MKKTSIFLMIVTLLISFILISPINVTYAEEETSEQEIIEHEIHEKQLDKEVITKLSNDKKDKLIEDEMIRMYENLEKGDNKTYKSQMSSMSFELAIPITIGTKVEDSIQSSGQEDYFSFTPTQSGKYIIETEGNTDTYGCLYNSDYTNRYIDDDNGRGYNFRIATDLEANETYYIKVMHYCNEETGDYSLIVKKCDTKVVSGAVSLPNENLAPSGGIELIVQALYNTVDGYEIIDSNTLTIEEGENSESYSLNVINDEIDRYVIRYSIKDDNINDYAHYGFYSKNGTKGDWDFATEINVGESDLSCIDLELLQCKIISGNISLPNDEVAPAGGIELRIIASEDAYSDEILTINEGESSTDYSIKVPDTEETSYYYVYYSISSDNADYVQRGYYNKYNTVYERGERTYINIKQDDTTNINLELITGIPISGQVSLPNGEVVSYVQGIELDIEAEGDYYFSDSITIETRKNSANYTVIVPNTGRQEEYVMGYYSYNNKIKGYVNEQYCINSVVINESGIDNIDIELITGVSINGTISLIEGEVAPYGGIELDVVAWENDHYETELYIEEGQNSTSYTLTVPVSDEVNEYEISYWLEDEIEGYLTYAFYSTNGTTNEWSEATIVEVSNQDIYGIDIELMTGLKIMGTISLPEGEVAPVGGIELEVNAQGDIYDRTGVFIEEGQNSVPYTLTVPESDEVNEYIIAYWLEDKIEGYMREAYYSIDGTTRKRSEATRVEVLNQDISEIDIELMAGIKLMGTISLSEGEVAPAGGIELQVRANGNDYDSTEIYIEEGQNLASYTLTVPECDEVNEYIISYDLLDELEGYVREAHYSLNGTTTEWNLATPIEVLNQDVTEIDIELMTKKTISGIISLPAGEVAPAGGIDLEINNDYYDTHVFIEEGQNSVPYKLDVLETDEVKEYKISYWIKNEIEGYINEGYYCINGTTQEWNQATQVEVSNQAIAGIDIELMTGIKIIGTISLPEGEIAPSGGIAIEVKAVLDKLYYTGAFIEEGQSSAIYMLTVPKSDEVKGYEISYWIKEEIEGYISSACYNINGTTTDWGQATPVEASNQDVSGIDIELVKEMTISEIKIIGTISLPSGEVAPVGGIDIVINAEGENYYGTEVFIEEGQNSAPYTLALLENDEIYEYKITYLIIGEIEEYISFAYYNINGTTTDDNSATLIQASNQDVSDIDIKLLTGIKISGTMLFPEGEVAPAGGNYIQVKAEGIDCYTEGIIIEEGQNSAPYTLTVPKQNEPCTYKISYYFCNADKMGYLNEGFYSDKGTIYDQELATLLEVYTEDITGIDMVLIYDINILDLNNDGTIDIFDLNILSNHYGNNDENANLDSKYDLNNDGIVNIYDLVILARQISQ